MGQGAQGAQLEDRYFLQKVKLGQGSFGTVWRAVDRQNDRVVAIKQLDKASLPRRGVKRQDIEREVDMMRACSHENLTQLFDTFEDANNIYLALEYCDGGDFGDKVKERGMAIEERETAEWMRQMCASIAALHAKKICHRDIKPDNFMVSTRDNGMTLKLSDFGLAIFLPPGKILTEKCGTPAFMAPEQHTLPKQSRGYSFPADMWAAGVSMYMMMFGGRHPFMTGNGTLDDKMLLKGTLDFREKKGQQLFGFDLGMGDLRFSEVCRQLCGSMVQPDEKQRLTADDALRNPWLQGSRPRQRIPSQPTESWPKATASTTAGSDRSANQGGSSGGMRPQSEIRLLKDENSNLKAQLEEQQLQMRQYQGRPSDIPQPSLARGWTTPIDAAVTKAPCNPAGVLRPGTKCRYWSGKFGWLPCHVQCHNDDDGTYDLDVRPHADLSNIAPCIPATLAEAWPPGTFACYHSISVNLWLAAVVVSYNESDKTYNLDVRDHADADRIRARLSDRPMPGSPLQSQARSLDNEDAGTAWAGSSTPTDLRSFRAISRGGSKTSQAPELRDGSAAAPLRVQDLADCHTARNDPAASNCRVGQGMYCTLVNKGPARIEVASNAPDGTFTVVLTADRQRLEVAADQLRAPVEASWAWPPGTKVNYHSSSSGKVIPATIVNFNASKGRYNLDVRENATADRVMPR